MGAVKFRYDEFDSSDVRTYPLHSRPSKVRREDFARPWITVLGDAAPVPLGDVEAGFTVRLILVDPERDCASVMLAGSDLGPGVVPGSTVVENEKVLSPAVTSPLVPSS